MTRKELMLMAASEATNEKVARVNSLIKQFHRSNVGVEETQFNNVVDARREIILCKTTRQMDTAGTWKTTQSDNQWSLNTNDDRDFTSGKVQLKVPALIEQFGFYHNTDITLAGLEAILEKGMLKVSYPARDLPPIEIPLASCLQARPVTQVSQLLNQTLDGTGDGANIFSAAGGAAFNFDPPIALPIQGECKIEITGELPGTASVGTVKLQPWIRVIRALTS